jgi:Protein of unknown function (DUF2652)
MATPAAANEVLFFIPDLGGFTKFIAETEIQHSQHIIKELLETLVDANTLGMKVSEFDGDAVLFYRNGAPPSLEQLVQQARKMYLDFHTQLKKFAYARGLDQSFPKQAASRSVNSINAASSRSRDCRASHFLNSMVIASASSSTDS